MAKLTLGGWVRALSALAVVMVGTVSLAHAANTSNDGVWQDVNEAAIARSPQARVIVPDQYRTLRLARAVLDAQLKQAPLERDTRVDDSPATLYLPTPSGAFNAYRIVESPVMAPALAKLYPQLKTYVGQGITDPTATVRLDLTPTGFRAQIISWQGTSYIDPYQPGDVENYIAYRKADYQPANRERPKCLVTGQALAKDLPNFQQRGINAKISSGTTLRTYRLAVAATGEYTAFHGGTVADGLGAIVTTMNRVNGIYERELAVRMVLIANNDQLIYTDGATDPYTNGDGVAMLSENTSNLNTLIGAANFDIGHVVSTGGGGVAGLGVVCTGGKARGVTGLGAPVTDAYDVDFVAHEMGHQFAGSHTFNGSGGNCSGGNRSGPQAYETGSGVTIQAYAGICGADNTQPNSEDYFHRVSLNQMLAFTTTGAGGTCGAATSTGNTPPTVDTFPILFIPRQTPIELTATGSDSPGETLTYIWEQFDLGDANSPGALVDNGGPLFRSFAPTLEPTRIVPSLRWVLNNANVPPVTAPLPGTTGPNWFTGELLASTDRTLRFTVTARDNRAGGGGTNESGQQMTVVAAAGPFAVTVPNTAVSWPSGNFQTITWDVAGTDAMPIRTRNVRIRLSTDGGYTWPIVLAESALNNGSASLQIPPNTPATTQARVRIDAIDNIYFDVSDVNFTITGANTAPSINVTGAVATRQGSPSATAPVATISDTQDGPGALTVSVSGAPPELAVSVVNNGGTVSLTATAQCSLVSPGGSGTKAYPVILKVTDTAGASTTASVNVNVGPNQTPTLGNYTGFSVAPNTTTVFSPTAAPADANNNLVAPTVSPATLPGGGTITIAANGAVSVNTTNSTTFGTYAVRPSANDSCGASEQRQFNITIASPNAALAVTSSQIVPTGNAIIEPNECNQLNVTINNSGSLPATGVTAVLSTTSPNVTITQPNTSFNNIPSGQSATSLTPFQISTGTALTCFSNVNFTLTVSFSGGPSPLVSQLSFPVGTAGTNNYSFTPSSGAAIPSGGTLVTGSQDDDALVNLQVPAGFNFSVYGTNITGGSTVRASTNGTLQLTPSGGSREYENAQLPNAGDVSYAGDAFPAVLPVLMPYWDDLDMRPASVTGGGIFENVTGTAPNRKWIIEWRGKIWEQNSTGNALSVIFAIEISEGASTFDYLYAATGVGPGANGASATVGVQAATTGTSFGQYLLNQPLLAAGQRLSAAILPGSCVQGRGQCAGPTTSSTSLVSGTNPSLLRQPVTFTASVTSAGAPVSVGTVNFLNGAAPICSNVAVNGLGVATCTTNALPVGTRAITAAYLGGGPFGGSTSAVVNQQVNIDPIVITPTTLPNMVVAQPYSQQLTATSVSILAPVTWTVSAGALPGNVTLSAAGLLSGTPAALGTFNFTASATDSAALNGTRAYTVNVVTDVIFANGFQ